MRVFGIGADNRFQEYVRTRFELEHEEAILESWLESNPEGILEDGRVLIVGRQVRTGSGFIDLLGIDRQGAAVVIEMKRDRTPRDTIAQALEYASFAEQLDADQLEAILRSYLNDESLNLAEYHRAYFDLGPDEAVAFNKDQRIVIVGQVVTPEIRRTASFLRSKGLLVTCVEFTFFQSDADTRLLSQEVVVGKEPPKGGTVTTNPSPVLTQKGFMAALDSNGTPVFSRLFQLAHDRSMPIHWGTKGFSLNVDVAGTHVAVCFGYGPEAVYKQSLYTTLRRPGGLASKTAVPDDVLTCLWTKAQATGLFTPVGGDFKLLIDRHLSTGEIDSLIAWCEAVAKEVVRYGLKE